MVKMPNTIYMRIVDECLTVNERRFPLEMAVNEFMLEGYGREKARKWILQLAVANGDSVDLPWINIKFRQ